MHASVNAHPCFHLKIFVCVHTHTCTCVHIGPCFPCRLIKDEVSTCALGTSGSGSYAGTVPCYHLRAERGENCFVRFFFFFFILLSCLSLRKQNRLNSLLVACGEI